MRSCAAICLSFLAFTASAVAGPRARNIVLFVGDAGGLPTISAAGLYAGRPQQLFIQRMPNLGLMETSSASAWVADSASTMTAIVTGSKTQNGVLSQSAAAVRGTQDGTPLTTILELAEQRGLATGVITNSPATDATPAACYSHVNDRGKTAEILAQFFKPRFGDGVDVLIGAGRKRILEAAAAAGFDVEAAEHAGGYQSAASAAEIPKGARRIVMLLDNPDFDLAEATLAAVGILSRSPKGYFLMVESDLHAEDVERALKRAVALDALIQRVAEQEKDTLVIYTADHSFDLRVRGGSKAEPLLAGLKAAKPSVRVESGHTGEEVLVAAHGPGAERVRGFFPNTQLFRIMLGAYGWPVSTGR